MKRSWILGVFVFSLLASAPTVQQSEAQMGAFAYSQIITLNSQVIALRSRIDELERIMVKAGLK